MISFQKKNQLFNKQQFSCKKEICRRALIQHHLARDLFLNQVYIHLEYILLLFLQYLCALQYLCTFYAICISSSVVFQNSKAVNMSKQHMSDENFDRSLKQSRTIATAFFCNFCHTPYYLSVGKKSNKNYWNPKIHMRQLLGNDIKWSIDSAELRYTIFVSCLSIWLLHLAFITIVFAIF